MPSTAVRNGNLLALPSEIREHLQLAPGDRVRFRIVAGGQVVVERDALPVTALKGVVRSTLARKVTLGEMDEAIAEAAVWRLSTTRDRH